MILADVTGQILLDFRALFFQRTVVELQTVPLWGHLTKISKFPLESSQIKLFLSNLRHKQVPKSTEQAALAKRCFTPFLPHNSLQTCTGNKTPLED